MDAHVEDRQSRGNECPEVSLSHRKSILLGGAECSASELRLSDSRHHVRKTHRLHKLEGPIVDLGSLCRVCAAGRRRDSEISVASIMRRLSQHARRWSSGQPQKVLLEVGSQTRLKCYECPSSRHDLTDTRLDGESQRRPRSAF